MIKTTTLQIKQARPNDKEVEAFWKLYRAAQRVENRWCQNTVPLVAEELANTQLSREEKMFLLRAWQVLVDGSGGKCGAMANCCQWFWKPTRMPGTPNLTTTA